MKLLGSALAHAYRRLSRTSDGARVFGDLFREGMLLDSCYVPGDPIGTAFNESKRRMALRIFSLANTTPERAQALADLARKDGYDT
jgi:hypothetical protein